MNAVNLSANSFFSCGGVATGSDEASRECWTADQEGRLGKFSWLRSGRAGLVLVAVGDFLYAIGGARARCGLSAANLSCSTRSSGYASGSKTSRTCQLWGRNGRKRWKGQAAAGAIRTLCRRRWGSRHRRRGGWVDKGGIP